MPRIADVLKQFRQDEFDRHRAWERRIWKKELDHEERMRQASKGFLSRCVPAEPIEYARWLVGYLGQGGKPTHSYDRSMGRDFLALRSDAEILPLYGSESVSIIIPAGIVATCAILGHNNLYFMDGFRHAGSVVPLYLGDSGLISKLAEDAEEGGEGVGAD